MSWAERVPSGNVAFWKSIEIKKKGQVKARWSCDCCQDEFNDTHNQYTATTQEACCFIYINNIQVLPHSQIYTPTTGRDRNTKQFFTRWRLWAILSLVALHICGAPSFIASSSTAVHYIAQWRRNSLGCWPGKKYFVICQWNNLAYLRITPAGMFSSHLLLFSGITFPYWGK